MKELNANDFIVTKPVKLNEIPTVLVTGKKKKKIKTGNLIPAI
jgi:hypothetical protein